MMISPELFTKLHINDSYEELISLRDELVESIRSFESMELSENDIKIMPSPEVIYSCNLLYLSELCRIIEDRFQKTKKMPQSSAKKDNIKRLGTATKISVDDDIYFDRSVDVLNECFGKDYNAWMRGGLHLDKSKTIFVWFPKMAVYEFGVARAQSKTKGWINVLSEDGKTIHEYSDTESYIPEYMGLRIVFAKFPGKPYKYIGSFVDDLDESKPNYHVFRRVSTELDLTPWKK